MHEGSDKQETGAGRDKRQECERGGRNPIVCHLVATFSRVAASILRAIAPEFGREGTMDWSIFGLLIGILVAILMLQLAAQYLTRN